MQCYRLRTWFCSGTLLIPKTKRSSRLQRALESTVSRPDVASSGTRRLPLGRAVLIPAVFALGAAAPALIPSFRAHAVLFPTFLGAGGFLLAWTAWLYATARSEGRTLQLQILLKKPHWVQAGAQAALLLYWGWHVRPVFGNLPFLFGQLLFAYGLDALLQWSRRDTYQLGFGPIPIILSINFFLWFRPEWYYWQFVIIALGYVAKEFIQWQKHGRRAHIFNPSSFALAVFSVVLIVTGTTNATLGLEIAQTLFNPPHIFWVIFLVALPAQILFRVTTMTIASVVTAYAWGLIYFSFTGTYFFRDAFVPIAVFLGMHLLFTDPATSPRTEVGRVIYGVLYAVFTIALASILEAVGAPSFYDKLLPIPILNIMVRRIDRAAVAAAVRIPARLLAFDQSLGAARHGLAVVALWVVTFLGMTAAGGLGDDHPGQYLPFWEKACTGGSARACVYVAVMETNFCDRGSAWACNELGINRAAREGDPAGALRAMRRSCDLGFSSGCANVVRIMTGETGLDGAQPRLEDLPIILRGSKGAVEKETPAELYALACERGWPNTCGRISDQGGP